MSLQEIARRAALRKADQKLRHAPNEADLKRASEHAEIMKTPQYEAIKPDKEESGK